jgi:hypothetical protein
MLTVKWGRLFVNDLLLSGTEENFNEVSNQILNKFLETEWKVTITQICGRRRNNMLV